MFVMMCSGKTAYAEQITALADPFPPFSYIDKDTKQPSGFAVEIIQAILEHSGLQFKLEIMPWARVYNMATNEPNILIFPLNRTQKREKLFKWIASIHKSNFKFFKLKSRKDIQIQSLNDAKKYIILTMNKSVVHSTLTEKFGISENIYPVPSLENAIKMLYLERGELIAQDKIVIMSYIKEFNLDPEKIQEVYPFKDLNTLYYFAVSIQTSDELVSKLRKGFDKFLSTGQIQKIKDKYLGAGN